MATVSFNIPLLSIPFYYLICAYPHGHAIFRALKGRIMKHDNRNPKGTAQLENLKRRLTPREFAAFERGESCHRNNLENMPLYVAAVFAGLLAEQKVGEGELGLITFCIGWNLIRMLYSGVYLMTESQQWSYVRTLLYYACTLYAFYFIGRAAVVVGSSV